MAYVLERITEQGLENLKGQLSEMNEIVRLYAVRVEDKAKMGVRTMAEGREGKVRLIAKIAAQHENSLSRSDNAAMLDDLLRYDADLEAVRQALLQLMERIEKTQWGNSADIMEVSDRFERSLQAQRRNNASLDTAMAEIDEWNKRHAEKPQNEAEGDSNMPLAEE